MWRPTWCSINLWEVLMSLAMTHGHPISHYFPICDLFWLLLFVAMQGISLRFTLQDKRSASISLYRVRSDKKKSRSSDICYIVLLQIEQAIVVLWTWWSHHASEFSRCTKLAAPTTNRGCGSHGSNPKGCRNHIGFQTARCRRTQHISAQQKAMWR